MAAYTTDEQIARLEAKLAKLKAQKKAGDALSDLRVGDRVEYLFGRGDTRRILKGDVVAVYPDEAEVTWAAMLTGEGRDIQLNRVRHFDIIKNDTAMKRHSQ